MNTQNSSPTRTRLQSWWRNGLLLIAAMLFMVPLSNAQVNYSFNFDANSTGWTGNFTRSTSTTGCGGTPVMRRNIYTATVGTLVSPLTGAATGGQITITYDYKVNVWSANTTGASTPWGSFNVEYAASTAGPWTLIATVGEEAQTSSCIGKSHTFTPPAGNVYVRWITTYTGGDNYWNFDNVVLSEAPAFACSGTPAPGNTTGPSTTLSGSPIALGLQNQTPGTGVTYQWEENINGGGWGNAPSTGPTYNPSPTQSTQYRCIVTCAGNGSTTSNELSVVVVPTVEVPFSGNNTVACGTDIVLLDHGGTADYGINANGYTVLEAGNAGIVTISGPYNVENGYDNIRLFSGAGTLGTLLQTYTNIGTINYTGTPGESLTVQFTSDGSVVRSGFQLDVTYSGSCAGAECAGTPVPGAAATSVASGCDNLATATLSLPNLPFENSYSYQWQSSTTGGAPWTDFGTDDREQVVTGVSTTTTYQCVVTCTNGPATATSGPVTITIYTTPNALALADPACSGEDLVLTGQTNGGGGTTFAWTGPNSYSSTEQNPIRVGVGITDGGDYNLVVTENGCSSVASTVAVTVNSAPVITTAASATPATICTGGSSQLNVAASISGYSVAPTAYAPITPPGATNPGPTGDDSFNGPHPLGFSFTFNGAPYTEVYISSNGYLTFGAGSTTIGAQTLPNTLAPNNVIALAWRDLNPGSGGTIDWFTMTGPDRFVARFNTVSWYGGGGSVDAQVIIYADGTIEVHNTAITSSASMTQGVENSTGTLGTAVPGRNNATWGVTVPDAFRFTANAPSYLWDNAGVLDDASLPNPLASNVQGTTTFTVTASANGCDVQDAVTVSVEPPPSATPTVVPDCGNNQFTVDVVITGVGSGSSAGLSWTVNGAPGAGSPLTGLPISATPVALGPFAATDKVEVSLLHESNASCEVELGTFYSGCPIVINCAATTNETFCYGNNETRTYLYATSIPGQTVTINFSQGDIDLNDAVNIYDGPNNLAPALGGGNFGGSIAGQTFTTSQDSLFIEFVSDGSVSCEDALLANQLQWTVQCTPTDCTAPFGFYDVTVDCNTLSFTVDVQVFDAGTQFFVPQSFVNVIYQVGAAPADTIVHEVFVDPLPIVIGPYPLGTVVNVTLGHESDNACNVILTPATATFTACPNDEICEARLAPINPNYTCVQTVPGDLATGSASPQPNACGGTPNRDLWYRFAATSTDHRVSVLNFTGGGGVTMAGFAGVDCSTAIAIPGACSTTQEMDLSGLTPGDSIFIRVFNTNGALTTATFDFCASTPPLLDVGASALAIPTLANTCLGPAEPVSVTITNNTVFTIDFSVDPVTVNTDVTGAATTSLSGTISTGTLAGGASVDVPMSTTLDMSAAGTYTFNAVTVLAGDPIPGNDAMAAEGRTNNTVALPQACDFQGPPAFTGANLTAGHANWREGDGATLPAGTTSDWASSTVLGTTTARINNYATGLRRDWVVGPKIVAQLGTVVQYKMAITNWNSAATDPGAGFATTDDYLAVMVSTDCGVSFQEVFRHDVTNSADVTNALVQKQTDLSAFAGQSIIVALFGSDGAVNDAPDYDLHIDDINIETLSVCAGTPPAGAVAASSNAGPGCGPLSTTLSLTGYSTEVGVGINWYSSPNVGGPFNTYVGSGATVLATGLIQTTYFQAYEVCLATLDSTGSNVVSTTIDPTPATSASNSGPICEGSTLNLTGTSDIGTTFAWTGPNSFTSTEQNPSIPTATAAASGTYTFTSTLGACSTNGTTDALVNPNPVITSLTATPNPICENSATSQLEALAPASGFTVTAITHAPVSGTNIPAPSQSDDGVSIGVPIGFTFPFYGNSYSALNISCNGFVSFTTTGSGCCSGELIPGTGFQGINNVIALAWDDLNVGNGGSISTFNLNSPNRFVVDFTAVPFYVNGPGTVTGQIILYETGVIEIHSTAIDASGQAATQGVENSTDTEAEVVPGRNSAAWTATNDAYRFTPNSYDVSWSPGTNLSAANIPNPVFGPVVAGNYPLVVTATNAATGCFSTGNIAIDANPALSTGQASITPANATICSGDPVTLTANPLGGGGPYTYAWTDPNSAAAGTDATVSATIGGLWSVTITDACLGSASASTTVLTATKPSASASAGPACVGLDVDLDGTSDIGTSFAWSGPNGFSSTNEDPSISAATVADNGTYTFVATLGECSSDPATVEVAVLTPPSILTATATPSTVCAGEDVQLASTDNAPAYVLSPVPFAPVTGGTPTNGPSGDDGTSNAPIGFTFNYFGVDYTTVNICTNGFLSFTSASTAYVEQTLPDALAPNAVIALCWEDLTATAGQITYFNLTAPNRFVVDFNNVPFLGGSGFVDAQVILFEDGTIEFQSTSITMGTSFDDATMGIENTNGTVAVVVPGRNSPASGWTAANEGWRFSAPATTYSWTPTAFLNDETLQSPIAEAITATTQYAVTVALNGCESAPVTVDVTVNPLPVVDAGTYPVQCGLDASTDVPLVGTPAGGTFSGTGVSGAPGSQVFDPSVGTQTVTYTYDDGTCTNSADVVITVEEADGDLDGIPDFCDECPAVYGQIGDFCNAGLGFDVVPGTLDASCNCVATPCTENIVVDMLTPDGNSQDASFEIYYEGTPTLACRGGFPSFPSGITTPIVTGCCLPAGCFKLYVYDSAGDGFASGGGYEVREQGANGRRIIDNNGNFTNGNVSTINNSQSFCLPIGDIGLINHGCDKLDWVDNQYLVCHADANVSAEWQVGNQNNDGYNFWIFDPNGSYSFRRFRTHATSDGFSPATATRAAHLKINGWSDTPLTPHIPANAKMNVRVRGVYNWNFTPWGPTCTMMIDPARAACPVVWLQDDATNTDDYSCGVTRSYGGPNSWANRIVAKPPQFQPAPLGGGTSLRYQFRFRIEGEQVCIVRPPQTSPTMFLNWTTGTMLECSKTYEVDVRVSKDGGATWCVDSPNPDCYPNPIVEWGRMCTVTIGCTTVDDGGSQSLATTGGALTMYPNPNRGDQLFINLTEIEADVTTVSVDIYDLSGKRVSARTIAVQDGFLNTTLELNGDLAGGMYMVNITAGDKAYTERLVITP